MYASSLEKCVRSGYKTVKIEIDSLSFVKRIPVEYICYDANGFLIEQSIRNYFKNILGLNIGGNITLY